MAQGAPVKVLRSQVIGALKFLENICENHEKLVQESNSNTIHYENIIKKLEKKTYPCRWKTRNYLPLLI